MCAVELPGWQIIQNESSKIEQIPHKQPLHLSQATNTILKQLRIKQNDAEPNVIYL